VLRVPTGSPSKTSAVGRRPNKGFPHLGGCNFKVLFSTSGIHENNSLASIFTIQARTAHGNFSKFFSNHS
jgi:hypothetical protein